ncbi:putative membrane protein YqjE [Friedmanniella endophytica]|uniref:Putative membrane protein YqjE n=1 Tax=Microlunatus kandeliicorticis TaxID=1759536 RepID=A0A7W3IRM0_9ACTN|nr:phage holin family protein [Microlunatus kandeliicorticis]MBA8793991.1 putative membrane protein YqjE [Microlunatus kandeliicorticis]
MATTRSSDQTPGVGELVKDIQADIKQLVQNEVALAKAELVPSAKKAGVGAGLLGGAGYFGLCAAALLFIAGALAIGAWLNLPVALGFVIMAAVLLVVAAILGGIGFVSIKKVKGPARTIAQAKASVETVTTAIKSGTAAAKGPLPEGSGPRALGGRTTPARRAR